jgi:hypothetical protein
VFTKFDIVVSRVLFDTADGDTLHHERARARAHIMYEDSCRRMLHKEPRDVPAEIVSGIYSYFPMLLVGSADVSDHPQRAPDSLISSTI